MNLKNISSIAVAAFILASSSAFAAESQTSLSKINGEVMVNQGQSYINAQEGMQLNTGDQLMVMEGGQATIEYADGCMHKLESNAVFRVSEQSACVANVAAAPQQGPQYMQGNPGSALAAGGAAIAGGLFIWSQDDNDNDNDPNITGAGNN